MKDQAWTRTELRIEPSCEVAAPLAAPPSSHHVVHE